MIRMLACAALLVPVVATAGPTQVTWQAKADTNVDYLYETAHYAGKALVGFHHEELDAPAGGPPFRRLRRASEVALDLDHTEDDGTIAMTLTGSWREGLRFTLRPRGAVHLTLAIAAYYRDGEVAGLHQLTEETPLATNETLKQILWPTTDLLRITLRYTRDGEPAALLLEARRPQE